MCTRKTCWILISAAVVSSAVSQVHAASTWTGGASTASPASGNWNTAGNWSPSGVPGANTETIFGGNTTYNAAQNIGAGYSFGTITLNSTAAGGDTISGSSFQPGNGTIQQNNSAAFLISNAIGGDNAAETLTLAGNGTGIVTLTGQFTQQNTSSHTLTLKKFGSSTFILSPSSASAYTGGITIAAGTLIGTSASAFGGSAIALNGGTLGMSSDTGTNFGDNVTVGGNVAINSNRATNGTGVTHTLGTLAIGANTLSILAGGSITAGTAGVIFGNTTLNTNGAIFDTGANTNLTLGAIGGNFTFTKQGSGILTLNTASSRTVGSTINGGTVALGNATGLGTGSVTISSATLSINGVTDSVASISLNAGAVAGSGTLALGGSVVSTGASLMSGSVSLGATRTFDVTNTLTASGRIFGTGFGITKTSAGELILSGNNAYTGLTDIQNGQVTLKSTGNIAGSIRVASGKTFDVTDFGATGFSVANGATLSGSGTVNGKTKIGGTAKIAPGDAGSAPSSLATGDEEWASGGTYTWDIKDATGTAGGGFDQLQMAGTLNVTATSGSKFNIDVTSLTAGNANGDAANFVKTNNYDWVIATTSNPVTIDPTAFAIVDHFTNDTTATTAPGAVDGAFSVSGSGNDVILHYSAAPEPGAIALLAVGLGGYLGRRPRRR